MEITEVEAFINYYQKTRQLTNKVVHVIPPDKVNWTYRQGKFTIGDLVRHIAAIERYVFAEMALGGKPSYKGCGRELADRYENIISFFNQMHLEAMEIFSSLTNELLKRKIVSLDRKEIELSSFLSALVVHEIHHRAALCIYLNLLGIDTPQIFGLKEEQVKLRSV